MHAVPIAPVPRAHACMHHRPVQCVNAGGDMISGLTVVQQQQHDCTTIVVLDLSAGTAPRTYGYGPVIAGSVTPCIVVCTCRSTAHVFPRCHMRYVVPFHRDETMTAFCLCRTALTKSTYVRHVDQYSRPYVRDRNKYNVCTRHFLYVRASGLNTT